MSKESNWNHVLRSLCWCVNQDESCENDVTCTDLPELTSVHDQKLFTELHNVSDVTSLSFSETEETVQKSNNEKRTSIKCEKHVNENVKSSSFSETLKSKQENARSESSSGDFISDVISGDSMTINERFKSGASYVYMTLNSKVTSVSSIAATDGSDRTVHHETLIPSAKTSRVSLATKSPKSEACFVSGAGDLNIKTSTKSKHLVSEIAVISHDEFSSVTAATTKGFHSPSLISETTEQLTLNQSNAITCSSTGSEVKEDGVDSKNCAENTSNFDFSSCSSSEDSFKKSDKSFRKSIVVDKTLDMDTCSAAPKNKIKFASRKRKESDASTTPSLCSAFVSNDTQESKPTSVAFTSVKSSTNSDNTSNSSKCSYDSGDTTSNDIDSSLLETSHHTPQHSTTSEISQDLFSYPRITESSPRPFSYRMSNNKPTMDERTSRNATMTICSSPPKGVPGPKRRVFLRDSSMYRDPCLNSNLKPCSTDSFNQKNGEPLLKNCETKIKNRVSTDTTIHSFVDRSKSYNNSEKRPDEFDSDEIKTLKPTTTPLKITSIENSPSAKVETADEIYEKMIAKRKKNIRSKVINVEYKTDLGNKKNNDEQNIIVKSIELSSSENDPEKASYNYKLDKNLQTEETLYYDEKLNKLKEFKKQRKPNVVTVCTSELMKLNKSNEKQEIITQTTECTCSDKREENESPHNHQSVKSLPEKENICHKNSLQQINEQNKSIVTVSSCEFIAGDQKSSHKSTSKSTLVPSMRKKKKKLSQDESTELFNLQQSSKQNLALFPPTTQAVKSEQTPMKELKLSTPATTRLMLKKAETRFQPSVQFPPAHPNQMFQINLINEIMRPPPLEVTKHSSDTVIKEKKIFSVSCDLVDCVLMEALESVLHTTNKQQFDKISRVHVNKEYENFQNGSCISTFQLNHSPKDCIEKSISEIEMNTKQLSGKLAICSLSNSSLKKMEVENQVSEKIRQKLKSQSINNVTTAQAFKDDYDCCAFEINAVSMKSRFQNLKKPDNCSSPKPDDVSPLPSDSELALVLVENPRHLHRREENHDLKKTISFQDNSLGSMMKGEAKRKEKSFFNIENFNSPQNKLSFFHDVERTKAGKHKNYNFSAKAQNNNFVINFSQPATTPKNVIFSRKILAAKQSKNSGDKDFQRSKELQTEIANNTVRDDSTLMHKLETKLFLCSDPENDLKLKTDKIRSHNRLSPEYKDSNLKKLFRDNLPVKPESQEKNMESVEITDTDTSTKSAASMSSKCLKIATKSVFQEKQSKISIDSLNQSRHELKSVFETLPISYKEENNKSSDSCLVPQPANARSDTDGESNEGIHTVEDLKSHVWASDDEFKSLSRADAKSNLSSSKHSLRKNSLKVSSISEEDFISACEEEINKLENLIKCQLKAVDENPSSSSTSFFLVDNREKMILKQNSESEPRKHLLPHERMLRIANSSSIDTDIIVKSEEKSDHSNDVGVKSSERNNFQPVEMNYFDELEAEIDALIADESVCEESEAIKNHNLQRENMIMKEYNTLALFEQFSQNKSQTKSLLQFLDNELKRFEKDDTLLETSNRDALKFSSNEITSLAIENSNKESSKSLKFKILPSFETETPRLIFADDTAEDDGKKFRQRNFSILKESDPPTSCIESKQYFRQLYKAPNTSDDELSGASYFTTKSLASLSSQIAIPKNLKIKKRRLKDKVVSFTEPEAETYNEGKAR